MEGTSGSADGNLGRDADGGAGSVCGGGGRGHRQGDQPRGEGGLMHEDWSNDCQLMHLYF